MKIKLSEWAKRNGITYRTAWNWFKQGKIPAPTEKMPSGAIYVIVMEKCPHCGKEVGHGN